MTKISKDQLKNISGGGTGNEDIDVTPAISNLQDSRKSGGSGSGGQGPGAETPSGGGGIGGTTPNQDLG